MERLPGESANEFHHRLCQAIQAQRLLDLKAARAEADQSGKQIFDYESFRQAYQRVRPYRPGSQEMEMEYYLDYRAVQNLDEFVKAIFQTDLYDGGDMHPDDRRG